MRLAAWGGPSAALLSPLGELRGGFRLSSPGDRGSPAGLAGGWLSSGRGKDKRRVCPEVGESLHKSRKFEHNEKRKGAPRRGSGELCCVDTEPRHSETIAAHFLMGNRPNRASTVIEKMDKTSENKFNLISLHGQAFRRFIC